jgi:hypothetical protein
MKAKTADITDTLNFDYLLEQLSELKAQRTVSDIVKASKKNPRISR